MNKFFERTSMIFMLTLICVFSAKAQIYYRVNDTLDVIIHEKTDPEYISAFLKENKATDIEFNSREASGYPFRLKNKKGNWMLCYADGSDAVVVLPKKGRKYSLEFPTSFQERMRMTWATRKNQKYWVSLDPARIETKMAFDQVNFITKMDTQYVDYGFEGRELKGVYEKLDKIVVRIDNKWGLIEPSDDSEKSLFYLSRNFLYETSEGVPPATWFSSYQLKMMEDIRKDFNVDLLVNLDANGFYFKGRDEKTGLYGLYVGEGEASQNIPAKYDDIKRHIYEETFEVWKDDKVGYYNSNFELTKEPIYDDFHFMHLDYKKGCALKKEGYWQLFDNYDGSLLVEGKAKTLEELQELWLNRH